MENNKFQKWKNLITIDCLKSEVYTKTYILEVFRDMFHDWEEERTLMLNKIDQYKSFLSAFEDAWSDEDDDNCLEWR